MTTKMFLCESCSTEIGKKLQPFNQSEISPKTCVVNRSWSSWIQKGSETSAKPKIQWIGDKILTGNHRFIPLKKDGLFRLNHCPLKTNPFQNSNGFMSFMLWEIPDHINSHHMIPRNSSGFIDVSPWMCAFRPRSAPSGCGVIGGGGHHLRRLRRRAFGGCCWATKFGGFHSHGRIYGGFMMAYDHSWWIWW